MEDKYAFVCENRKCKKEYKEQTRFRKRLITICQMNMR